MPSYTLHSNIPYTVTDHHPRQVLDLYLPKAQDGSDAAHPFILYIHGGAFKFGSKESDLVPLRQISNGYAIAAINYRRSGEAIFPAMIEDCKSALRFLKSADIARKYQLDTSKVVAWGESAGGHAAAFVGTTSQPEGKGTFDVGDYLDVSSSVNGIVDYYGPTDFLQMDAHLPVGFQTHNDADSPESLYLGAKITEIPDRVAIANPCTHIETMVAKYGQVKCPSFFVAHGNADKIVPEYMSTLFVDTLSRHNITHEYLPVDNTDHIFKGINETQQHELDSRTDAFLEKVFRK